MSIGAYEVVEMFERKLATFAGAAYGIAVDSCTNGLFLCCRYLHVGRVLVPAETYCSVPMAVIHAGGHPVFIDRHWTGLYQLEPYPIWDAAKRLRRGMFAELRDTDDAQRYMVLSFHAKKHLNIGRGGMILTDDLEAANWFRAARRDGRRDAIGDRHWEARMIGWNCYMTPEQAARGLMLFDALPEDAPDHVEAYPDLRTWPIFKEP